jgi:hypothetical protein
VAHLGEQATERLLAALVLGDVRSRDKDAPDPALRVQVGLDAELVPAVVVAVSDLRLDPLRLAGLDHAPLGRDHQVGRGAGEDRAVGLSEDRRDIRPALERVLDEEHGEGPVLVEHAQASMPQPADEHGYAFER